MVTNIVFVCDEQRFLFVCVHLFVSFENSKVHAVVNLLCTQHYFCHWTTRIIAVKMTQIYIYIYTYERNILKALTTKCIFYFLFLYHNYSTPFLTDDHI